MGEKSSLLLFWLTGEKTLLFEDIVSLDSGELIWLVGENIPLVTEFVPFGETRWLGTKLFVDVVKLFITGSTNSDVFIWDCGSDSDPGSAAFCSISCLLKLPCELVVTLTHSPSGDIRCIKFYTGTRKSKIEKCHHHYSKYVNVMLGNKSNSIRAL